MPYFKDADEVYANFGKLFQHALVDPDLGPRFRRADTTVQYRLRQPDAVVTVKMTEGDEGVHVDMGDTTLRPEVVMQMDADTAHLLWLGKVNVTVALARGDIRTRGPVSKVLRLVPLIKPVFPRYRELLQSEGREDLADVT